MMRYNNLLYTFLLFAIFLSCKDNTPSIKDSGLPEDFISFYDQFHTDSAFQMSRIQFPLNGLPSGLTEEELAASRSFKWQKNDWVLHKPFNNTDDQFIRTFDPISNDIVIETIQLKSTDIKMQRRFAKLGDDWYLIYYSGLN